MATKVLTVGLCLTLLLPWGEKDPLGPRTQVDPHQLDPLTMNDSRGPAPLKEISSTMLCVEYSELELAINTLVTEFHKAADNGPTLNTTQFQTLVSKHMPAISKTVENEEGLGQVLQHMEVQNGQNISFQNFWKLIDKQAGQLFNASPKDKGIKCTCQLQ